VSDILWCHYAKEAGLGLQNNFPDYAQLKAAKELSSFKANWRNYD
jgi:hypothetical protein